MKIISIEKQLPSTLSPPNNHQVEMLTIKKCAQQIGGLFEHTVQQLGLQNKLLHIRICQGKRGKILSSKANPVKVFEDGCLTVGGRSLAFLNRKDQN